MEQAQTTLLDMNDILGQSLDDTVDAPEFVNPPSGNYHLNITSAKVEKYSSKDKDTQEQTEKMRIRMTYSVKKTVELADPSEIPVADGALFSETFMANSDGLSFFKRQAKNVLGADNIQGVPLKDILAELENDKTISAKVKCKETEGSNGKTYTNVQVHILGLVDAV